MAEQLKIDIVLVVHTFAKCQLITANCRPRYRHAGSLTTVVFSFVFKVPDILLSVSSSFDEISGDSKCWSTVSEFALLADGDEYMLVIDVVSIYLVCDNQ